MGDASYVSCRTSFRSFLVSQSFKRTKRAQERSSRRKKKKKRSYTRSKEREIFYGLSFPERRSSFETSLWWSRVAALDPETEDTVLHDRILHVKRIVSERIRSSSEEIIEADFEPRVNDQSSGAGSTRGRLDNLTASDHVTERKEQHGLGPRET